MSHSLDSPLHLRLPLKGLQGELVLDRAAILEQTYSGNIRTDIQELQDVQNELLDLCIVMGVDTSGAVDDEDQIRPLILTGTLWGKEQRSQVSEGGVFRFATLLL